MKISQQQHNDKFYVMKCDPHHHRILRSYTIYQQIASSHIENETSKNKIKKTKPSNFDGAYINYNVCVLHCAVLCRCLFH